jgi:uncharacterized membrane protein
MKGAAAAGAPEIALGITAAYQQTMRLTALSSVGGHPLHPLVAPLPVGAFLSSLIFDILSRTRPGELPWLVDGAWWLIGVGLVGAGIAAVFGALDLLRIPRRAPAFTTGLVHLALNVAAALLFGIGYAWRSNDHVDLGQTRWGQLALSAVAVALLLTAVWLGQRMTYVFGVRVRVDAPP